MWPAECSTILITVFALIGPALSVRVQLFEEPNFKGYYTEITEVSDGCTNLSPSLPSFSQGSIKTDTCFIVFRDPDCKLYSAKKGKGGQNINSETFHLLTPEFNIFPHYNFEEYIKRNKPLGVRSFYPCNMTEGGPSLNIELFGGLDKVEFKNLCSCRNIPKDLHERTTLYANNHGNPFKVYTEQDCQGENRYIPAGYNDISQKINEIPKDFQLPFLKNYTKFKSLGPYKTSHSYLDHCVQLTSSVFKFEFLDSFLEDEILFEEDVEMASKTVFRNNGSAKITQVYQVKKSVKEVAEITTASSLGIVHKAKVETNFETEGEARVPFLGKSKVKAGIKLAYDFERTSIGSESNKTVAEESTEFVVSQQIDIPPCVEYSLSSFVKMIKDKPMEYKVYSKISGELEGETMTASQIREHVGDAMQVIRDFDAYSVVTSVKAVMKVSFGVRTFVNGEGTKIKGCVEKKKRRVENQEIKFSF